MGLHTRVALTEAANRLDALHAAAGRGTGSEAATSAVLDALADDLSVPRAIDIATEAGGQTAPQAPKATATSSRSSPS